MEKCFEIECSRCGAIFMNKEAIVPRTLECMCKNKDFRVAEAVAA